MMSHTTLISSVNALRLGNTVLNIMDNDNHFNSTEHVYFFTSIISISWKIMTIFTKNEITTFTLVLSRLNYSTIENMDNVLNSEESE